MPKCYGTITRPPFGKPQTPAVVGVGPGGHEMIGQLGLQATLERGLDQLRDQPTDPAADPPFGLRARRVGHEARRP